MKVNLGYRIYISAGENNKIPDLGIQPNTDAIRSEQFWWRFVLDSFNMVYSDQKYDKRIFRDLYYEDFKLKE